MKIMQIDNRSQISYVMNIRNLLFHRSKFFHPTKDETKYQTIYFYSQYECQNLYSIYVIQI